jgi:hypothetical protein
VDSPIILGTVYKNIYNEKPEYPGIFYGESFDHFIYSLFKKYNNLNIFLKRDDSSFNQNGRFQNLEQSKIIDNTIKTSLESHNISFIEFPVCPNTAIQIFNYIQENNL